MNEEKELSSVPGGGVLGFPAVEDEDCFSVHTTRSDS
jgi:hypothetical protein